MSDFGKFFFYLASLNVFEMHVPNTLFVLKETYDGHFQIHNGLILE